MTSWRTSAVIAALICLVMTATANAKPQKKHSSNNAYSQQHRAQYHRIAVKRHSPRRVRVVASRNVKMISRPAVCPPRAYCGCGAAVKVFGKSVRSLWPSSAWLRFPRAAPGHMKVAARRGHVFVIDYMIDSRTAMAWDFNSGRGQSRYHARSITGFTIVDPGRTSLAMRL